MNRDDFSKAQVHFNEMERCENLLIEIGLGNLHHALKKIPIADLTRYIEDGLVRELDTARDKLSQSGVKINESV